MTIQLIAIDIDDTLLTTHHQILPSTVNAIQKALAQGIKIVLCSGRPLAGVQPYLTQLGIYGPDQYVVTYNGAVVAQVNGEILVKQLLPKAVYTQLTAFAQAHHIPFNVLDEHSTIYTADRNIDFITAVQAVENRAGILVRQPAELPEDFAIAKGVFVGDKSLLDRVEPAVMATFTQEFSVIRAGTNFLEVMAPGVDKGFALAQLAENLALPASAVMAVGDAGNDLAMFAFAGTAVAMGNGTAIAKAQADHVTGTNDTGGLAAAIHKFALNPTKES
ncbi:Hydrolase [Agrilactobacillus composti DSM 18527 = JCM 14202]|uniref:Hydrolase n=1 Tax=Agrilactobacillus composti DSM 18527 = JCM 14202 TaxID=1423734 RepID=X0PUU9_9LACO|nr:Cof-type HAD-IIB family hydrolase [Agrilactobacillus composti]KRM32919.1 Hydrolase [Agrilactobacillus composti DSM 18527 = JCM 14202]GAF41917.1 hydrolase, Cof family [Agrilactobacillus composti DSM 18527 = JCM 14202]